MHRLAWVVLGIVVAVTALFAGPAWADGPDYTRHVGSTPAVGASDTNSGSGTQVLGVHFERGPNGEVLAFGGADIAEVAAVGVAAIAVGTVLVRRKRRPHTES